MNKTLSSVFIVIGILLIGWGLYLEKNRRAQPRRDLRVVLGYKDTRPTRFVGDVYESNYIAAKLEEMGFERHPQDDELFRGQNSTVRLVHSSASPDDEANRSDPWQKWLSRRARQEFVDGLREADAVFYVGHSRVGGGPDFEPPKLAKDGHVDYGYYKTERPGLESVRAGFRKNKPARLKFLGLYSCSSGPHFEKILKNEAPSVRFETTSEAIYYIDSLHLLVEGIKTYLEPET